MALTDILELETHEDGTIGVNAIVTANWSRLEVVFGSVGSLGSTGSLNLDANTARSKACATLTGAVTFTTSNLKAGRHMTIRIPNGGTIRAFTFPGWNWIGGTTPASIDANKVGVLELFVWGTSDGSVDARFSVEP